MKIQDYNKAMNEIHVNQETLVRKIQEKQVSGQTQRIFFTGLRTVLAVVLALVLFAGALFKFSPMPQKDSFTILAYAAGSDGILLSEEPVDILYDSRPKYLFSSEGTGEVNYQLWFRCEGDHIESITYRCSDEPITRSDLSRVPCYFVENRTVSIEERKECENQDNFLKSMTDTESGSSDIVQLIGNEYTVPYQKQDTPNSAIEVRCTTEKGSDDFLTAHAEPFTIEIIQTLTDGSTRTSTLLLTPLENAFDGLEIHILN